MTHNDDLLTAARFEDKLRTYWFMRFVLICVSTVIGIAILPIWFLGWGQWYVRRSFEALKCALHERTLVVKRGIFFKVEKTIPLDKIQDLTVKEGPLLRMLGLRSLKIENTRSLGGGSDRYREPSHLSRRGVATEGFNVRSAHLAARFRRRD
jgi:putative membrane protein